MRATSSVAISLFTGVTIALAGVAFAETGGLASIYHHACHATSSRWTVCGAFVITQPTASTGGPQALEGYTTVAHPAGTVGLAIGTIGNVEIAGAGAVTEARALQGGVVISGPGVVEHATSLMLVAPQPTGDYHGPVNVRRADWISFGKAWSIRPDGDRILLCDAQDRCRDL